ncbi:molybdopterin molybdotransferase MoeA [Psychrobacillus sp. INOP01]|uniref:molybdopterin molybdotransferase MoeA n=1 Tax=Psychrobacillus sp. INOP01 TaxID=2829187 RepID=UPI001BABF14E|nr:gephyrin-like molybdotransferase Glp [Psychrobacillus sp. INOP01]QUG41511.1 molybdopterin molybdotransferase MoeA [Psychrobacillus sp. INOP01]
MVEIRKPIPVKDAIQRVMEKTSSLPLVEISLSDSYGYILAEPIIAKHDVPSFNNSPYDGFAIRSDDSIGASGNNRIRFQVKDYIGAGQVSNHTLGKLEAVRIMTGAPIPKGADAVVMLEQTVESEESFNIRKTFKPFENVSLQGEDSKKGETLIPAGTFIHPGTIALLATFGYAKVKVRKKPVVGILCTGTELLTVEDELEPGKIRNSNGPMIEAQLKRRGIESRYYGILSDDLDSCYQLVKTALEETDCVITTGGVSVGDFDHLPEIYRRLQAEVLFNKVAMRPGSVTTAAFANGKLLFGLSGNPSACFTGYELFAKPAIENMMLNNSPYTTHTKAKLTEDFLKPNPFTRFVRSVYRFEGNDAIITPAGFNKSNAVSSIARGNALMVLPGGSRNFVAGDLVDVLLLGNENGVPSWNL